MGDCTPGPWKVNKYGSIGTGKRGTDTIVAHAEPIYGPTEHGCHAANAVLIASAPEMASRIAELEADNARMREALATCADLTERFLYTQREKVDDVKRIARAALGDA